MKDLILMAKCGPLEELEHEAAHCVRVKSASLAMLVHILLQILLAVLENKNKFCLCVYDVVQSNDVDMLELFHERDLADGGRWRPFFSIEVDLL